MINVIVSSDPRYRVDRTAIKMAVLKVLTAYRVRGKTELEVNIVGDRKMHELNRSYRGINTPSDVLSFALEDPSSTTLQPYPKGMGFVASPDRILRLGSIVISYPQAVLDAYSEGVPLEEEIAFLVEHGTEHLLGIHHD